MGRSKGVLERWRIQRGFIMGGYFKHVAPAHNDKDRDKDRKDDDRRERKETKRRTNRDDDKKRKYY
jgi:hypothetical protein